MSDPTKVTDIVPVAAMLVNTIPLNVVPSYVMDRVKLFQRPPTVATVASEWCNPPMLLQRSALLDRHDVDACVLPPISVLWLTSAKDMLEPTIVTDIVPVLGVLTRTASHACTWS